LNREVDKGAHARGRAATVGVEHVDRHRLGLMLGEDALERARLELGVRLIREQSRGELSLMAQQIIRSADTFFIASSASGSRVQGPPPQGVDVSHRGGPAGFVQIDHEGALVVPDYAGNFFFNTLGNLTLHPHAGLVFLDFERGDTLSIAADVEIIDDRARVESSPGAQRVLRLHVRSHRLELGACPLVFELQAPSSSRVNT